MSREKFRQTGRVLTIQRRLSLQGNKKICHAAGIISGPGRVFDSKGIGFTFIITAELEEQQAGTGFHNGAHNIAITSQQTLTEAQAESRQHHVAVLLCRMTCCHMPYLVAQNCGKLSFIIDCGEQTAGHIDITARGSESVDDRSIHDLETPVQARTVRKPPHHVANSLHVALQLIVCVDTVLFDHGLVCFHAKL